MLVLLSIDALRHDWAEKFPEETRNLQAVAAGGIRASSKPVFPTLTLPNHASIQTGHYVGSHGVMGNGQYLPETGEIFEAFVTCGVNKDENCREMAAKFYGEMPKFLWKRAEEVGRSVVWHWPLAVAALNQLEDTSGVRLQDTTIPIARRVEEALDCALTAPHAAMLSLYLGDHDFQMHRTGPFSTETREILKEIDEAVGYITKRLGSELGEDAFTLVIVSDHGSCETKEEDWIDLSKHIPAAAYLALDYEVNIWPEVGYESEVAEALLTVPNCKVWRKRYIPKALHFVHPTRTAPFILLPDKGYYQAAEKATALRGNHGYLPTDPDMQCVLLARGSAIIPSSEIFQTENVDVYALCCKILKIEVGNHEGDTARVDKMVRR